MRLTVDAGRRPVHFSAKAVYRQQSRYLESVRRRITAIVSLFQVEQPGASGLIRYSETADANVVHVLESKENNVEDPPCSALVDA